MFGLLKTYRNYFIPEFAALGAATFLGIIKESFSCICKIVCFFIIVFLLSNKVSGQITIASDGFNNSSALFNTSFSDLAAGYSNLSTTASDNPASTPYFIEGTHAIRVFASGATGGRSAVLTSKVDINTCSYSNVEMSLSVMAVSRLGLSEGPGSTDYILIEVSTNGGTNYNPILRLQGNGLNGSYWPYSVGTTASRTFAEYSTSPVTFTAGLRNAAPSYNKLNITGLPNIPNLRFRITVFIDDNTGDTPMWCIDDFKVTGQSLSSPLTPTTSKTDNTNCTPVPCTYTGPKLLINEIRINPGTGVNAIGSVTGTNAGEEFIELYNPSPCNSIDISCFLLGGNTGVDAKSNWTIRFPSGTIIPPLGFYTIAGDQVTGGSFYFKDYVAGGNFKNGFIASVDVSPWLYNQEDWKVLYDAYGNPLSGLAWGTTGTSITNINSDTKYNQPVQVVNRNGCPSITTLPTVRSVYNLNNPNIPVDFINNVGTPGTNSRTTDGASWGPLRAVTAATINSCNGTCNTQPSSCNGTATITPIGGVAPYLIAWDAAARNQNTQTAVKLCPGTYGVTITDACGNVTSTSVTITTNATCTTVPFSECNLVTYKVGDGSTALSNNAFPVRIDEVSTAGTLVQSLPSTLTQDANQLSAGYLNSFNGLLGIPGLDLFPGSSTPASTTNTKVTEILGSNTAVITRVTHPTSGTIPFNNNTYRSVIPISNNTFYAIGISGSSDDGQIWYYNGTSWTRIFSSSFAIRNIEIYNGNLYFSTATTSTTAPINGPGIYQVGAGLPTTTGQIATPVFNQSGGEPYGFSISPDGCTAYVADDRAAPNGGIKKWTKSGSTWSLAYTIGSPSRGLVVDYSGLNPIIYATTTATQNNSIFKITDAGSSSSSNTIRSAGANNVFRGIDFTPNSYNTITISQQPAGFIVCEGSPSQQMSVTASTTSGLLTYQWFRNTVNNYCGATAISGETNSTYSPPTTPPGTVYYFVKIINSCATILNSNIVAVTVNAAATVTASASNLNPCTGATVNLTGSFGGSATSAVWAIKSGGGTLNTSVTPPTYTALSSAGTVTLSYTSNDPDGTGPCPAATIDVVLTVANCNTCPTVWGNIQSPGSGSVCSGGTFDVYGQVYIPGVTEAAGQGSNVSVQLGWSTTNSNPSTWTNWINANYNTLGPNPSNIDEYFATLTLPPGNYYYAFRYSINGCPFVYGGYSPSAAAWNTWTVNPGGGGVFIGNSNNNGGSGSSLGINSNGKAFGLFNSSGSVTEVIRNFPALQVGQTFQVDLDNGSVNSGGTVGIALQNANGNNVWEFLFSGGSSSYTINAGSVSPSVNIPFTANGLRISFTLTSSTTYSAYIQALNGGFNYGPFTGTLSNPVGGQNISRFRAFNFRAGNGPNTTDFFINNIIGPNINDNASFYGAFANGTVSPNPTVGGIWSGITPSPSNNTSGILIVNPIPNVAVQPSPLCSGNNLTVSASGAGTYEFFLGGVSQGAPSATPSFAFSTLTAGQDVCVRGYPAGPVIDGNIIEPFWGNPIVTSAGGPSSSVSNNRINALYVNNQSGFLSLGIAGNLLNSTNTENDQKILIFIDSRSGGFNSLSGWTNRTNAPNLSVENLNSGISFDAGFNPDFILCIGTDNTGAAFFDLYDLTNNTNTFLGSSSGNPTLFGFQSNSGSTDYTKGFEIRIRNSLLGIISSPLRFFAMVVNTPVISNVTIVSNQFLSPAGSGDGSYGSGSISFGSAAPNPVSYSLSPDCLDDECLTVRATPVVSAPASFCVNNQITLSPTTGGTWTSSNNGIATVNNAGVATGVSIGQTSFTFTTVDGCSSITSPVNVNQVLTSTIQTN